MLLDEISRFLREQVAGRNLYTDQLVYSLEDGKLEGVYADRICFANICRSEYGLSFDMFLVTEEQIFALDQNGNRAALQRDYGGISVFRHEWALRGSTGAVTGSFRLVTTSSPKQTAQGVVCGVFDVALAQDTLTWQEEQALYRDQQSAGDACHPVAFDAASRLYFEDGKLRYSYKGSCFGVDPASRVRQPSADQFPEFLSKER